MPIPSNVTNEFIAPMKRGLCPHEEFNSEPTIDADLMEMFEDDGLPEYYYDEEFGEYVHIGPFDYDGDDIPQFNTDDYC